MAAYASLVSLMHVIHQIHLHPRPPISLDSQQVESLTRKVILFQEFLEDNTTSHVALETSTRRIVEAANAAADIIESHIVDQIVSGSSSNGKKRISSIEFNQSLLKVIQDMNVIEDELQRMRSGVVKVQQTLHSTFSDSAAGSSSRSSLMVGFDDISNHMKDMLIASAGQLDRKIIPIVGMAGIGKTTLARNLYQDHVVTHHFHIISWCTVSQEYELAKILLDLLHEKEDSLSYMDESDLALKLHQRLIGRRYLIVMDDVWDVRVWDRLKFFFPDDNNGSRIILTTRVSKIASQITNTIGVKITFLDEDNSWELFAKTVFGTQPCPLELEEIARKVVESCKGLPLSIVVVGGLLAKSEPTQEYWESIVKNLNSVVNLEDDERCSKILHTSYDHLPVYLKPCFLYMGVFREDSELRFTMLIKLWQAEGFLKPISGKSSEEVAKEFLEDLIDRNLILVHELGSLGTIKYCKIHDLLRDLSIREAQRESFYTVIRQHNTLNPPHLMDNAPQSAMTPLARSLIYDVANENLGAFNCRLLRIFEAFAKYRANRLYSLEELFHLVNSRYIAVRLERMEFPSSISLLWNLETLMIHNDDVDEEGDICAPLEIWNMSQLRHVHTRALLLPDPPCNHNLEDTVMVNLHTLKGVINFNASEEVVKRIPNIKKLSVEYRQVEGDYNLSNLDRLEKLQSFRCYVEEYDAEPSRAAELLMRLTFPRSLKKLTIGGNNLYWEEVLKKIGSLPLQVLKLLHGSFEGGTWETVEGQFQHLKFLHIEECMNWESWNSERSHFPRLERLVLKLLKLDEVPLGFAEIANLKSIEMFYCNEPLIRSAKRIQEEQEELFGEETTQVQVLLWGDNKAVEGIATPNFQVRYLNLPSSI